MAQNATELNQQTIGESLRFDDTLAELKNQIGGIAPFPNADIDGFLSHFVLMVQFNTGSMKGQYATITMPIAVQTVSRSSPFVYEGTAANHSVSIPLPRRSTLDPVVRESDFIIRPSNFFQRGKEVVWMQIINLDARADTQVGPIRIILGETVKREYPDFFRPSLGVAESLGRSGFPARLFFNPVAILETDFGVFRATHGVLAYGRIIEFPPIGAAVTISESIPMEPLEQVLERRQGKRHQIDPPVTIVALSHPIDMPMQIAGHDAFGVVEQQSAKSMPPTGTPKTKPESNKSRK
jgi:hypothetical protein